MNAAQDSEIPAMRVVREIDARIAAGTLQPGQRLIERELMETVNASRGTVREALRLLAGDGIVELMPNRGARIVLATTQEMVQRFQVQASLFRTAMELFAVRTHTPEIRAELRARTRAILDTIHSGDVEMMMVAMAEYNIFVAAQCGNDYLVEVLERMHWRLYFRRWARIIDPRITVDSCQEYAVITDHLLAGDAVAAYGALSPHIGRSIHQIGTFDGNA